MVFVKFSVKGWSTQDAYSDRVAKVLQLLFPMGKTTAHSLLKESRELASSDKFTKREHYELETLEITAEAIIDTIPADDIVNIEFIKLRPLSNITR